MNRDTICVQGGYTPGNGEPRQIPIIQSTTFKYATSEDMGKLFDLEADGYFYSRLQNPTNDAVAARIAALEHLLDADGLLDCLWKDFLADEEESAFIVVHILRLQWILFF